MIIGIHPDRIGTSKDNYFERWSEALSAQGVSVRQLNLLAPDALEQAQACDGVMWRWWHYPNEKQSAPKILYTIEHCLNIPVFPDWATAWHFDEKNAQYYLLRSLQAPVPGTWLFWNKDQALAWAEKEAPYPVVFKLSSGAGSSNVQKVDNFSQASELIERSFSRGIFPLTINESRRTRIPHSRKQIVQLLQRVGYGSNYVWTSRYPPLPIFWKPEFGYVYFQEFIPNNDFDTRITVIGDRAFGFRRLNRPDDFRASGSGRIEHDIEQIDPRCIHIAFDISRRAGFQSMAYDFLFRDRQPVITEISYAFADWAVHECPGHWDSKMTWITGEMWPEEAQALDFIQRVEQNIEKHANG